MRPLNLAQQQRMIHAASQDLPVRAAPLETAFCRTRISVRFLMTTTRMMQTRNYDATLFIFNQDQVQGLALVALTAIMMTFFFGARPVQARAWLRLGFGICILVLVGRNYLLRPDQTCVKAKVCPTQAIFALS